VLFAGGKQEVSQKELSNVAERQEHNPPYNSISQYSAITVYFSIIPKAKSVMDTCHYVCESGKKALLAVATHHISTS
jgi:hypothetical protein